MTTPLNYNTIYNDTVCVSFANLPDETVTRLLRDGRAVAFFLYEYLAAKHGLQRVDDEAMPAQFLADGEGRVFHVRIVTDNGTTTNPAKQNGCCRRFDSQEHRDRLDRLAGFFFVDVTKAPAIQYAIVPKMIVSCQKAHYSYELAAALISMAPSNTLKDFEEAQ